MNVSVLDVALLIRSVSITRRVLYVLLFLVLIATVAGQIWHRELRASVDAEKEPVMPTDAAVRASSEAKIYADLIACLKQASPAETSIERLSKVAGSHNFTVGGVAYRSRRDPHSDVRTLTFDLPISEKYTDVRSFVFDALDENPALALSALSLHRRDENTSLLTGTLSFTLYSLDDAP